MGVCATFRQTFRENLIQDFQDRFNPLSGDGWLIGIGKVTEWISATGSNADAAPPVNVDSIKSDTDFWRQAIAFKKISNEDVCLVVPRYDWTYGEVYAAYRDDVDLYDDTNPAKFYVLVDEERVYKCIDNYYDAPSTVAPTHTDYQIRLMSDGYRWKYLYSIPDSKRKFLTSSASGILGYMPVEYLTRINENDERILQWDVQQAAVTGSIDYVAVDEILRDRVISDRVVFPADENQVASAATAGTNTVVIAGPNLVLSNGYYRNFVFRVESGSGAGQQRVITEYVAGSNSATLTLQTVLDVGVTGGTGSDLSLYSIYPQIYVNGDGSSNLNTLNTGATTAEVTAKFLTTTVDGVTGARYFDSIEVVSGGKNYTYADITVISGLTSIPGTTADMTELATAIMSPPGGHGSNPVKELGASSLMIVTDFIQDEDGKVTVENDFRQFALIKNALLNRPQWHLRLAAPGLSTSFETGDTVVQGATATDGTTGYDLATGEIVEWNVGPTGTSGTAELVLTNVSGAFALKGIINGTTAFNITHVVEKRIAGLEGRMLKRLKLSPTGDTFRADGLDFTRGFIGIGVGNSASNVSSSESTGIVYSWEPDPGTNEYGNLYLEFPNGSFNSGEYIGQFPPGPSGGGYVPNIGKIIEIDEEIQGQQDAYNQTLNLQLIYDGITPFTDRSFTLDQGITAMSGGVEIGTAYVTDWVALSGNSIGTLKVLDVHGYFLTGNSLLYTNSSATGAIITEIVSEPELVYRSGEIVYLQNLRPIARSLEQTEEIKLVIEF